MKKLMLKNICVAVGLLAASAALSQEQNFDDVTIEALQVRDNIYMLVGSGGNITVQIGDDGVLIVDTQYAPLSDRILAKIRELSDGTLRFILNTHHHGDHTGGNANLKAAGSTVVGGNVGGDIADAGEGAQIIAHENALLHMVSPGGDAEPAPSEAWPTLTYFNDKRDMWFNGEGIRMLHQPNAHTDGDSIVYFRQSDVIAAGDVYITNRYPFIDVASGGSIQGVIAAANNIIDLIIPVYGQDGGTLVIPGHGRLSDIGDVINWREMLTIIRDRIQDMVDRGMALEEVQAARPTRDYDARWGADTGFWTTEAFVAAVYQNLSTAQEGSP
jgi:glyoxylase-like metal-dependent hydrolase (beta-lactamase superfamily II)